MKKSLKRLIEDLREFTFAHKKYWPHAGVVFVIAVLVLVSGSRETVHVYHREISSDFSDARVLGSNEQSMLEAKEALYAKTVKELQEGQDSLRETAEKLQKRLDELEPKGGVAESPTPPATATIPGEAVRIHDSNLTVVSTETPLTANPPRTFLRSQPSGKSIISFPVKEIKREESAVTLPSGSYVKAKLMTGVAAPEGKTYPVLLQLDFAYILPNKNKLDLAGCFMIAKSQGDLSTERVQMQATKLSCVSKTGKMFEREINGFVADDKDNSFAVSGEIRSKQDRVATMAFLSSIVEGVGKAIQQAQTTQQTNALGGSQSVVTGDQASYMAAGGASHAASLVTQWYLKQAQNLLPTINIGSGRDVWIVMQDAVKLPHSYFTKPTVSGDVSNFSYLSRLSD